MVSRLPAQDFVDSVLCNPKLPGERSGRCAGVAKLNNIVISLTVVLLHREAGKQCQVFRNTVDELDRLAAARLDFAFETTLSGLGHVRRLQQWKPVGYRIEMVFLRLRSPRISLRRIAARVRQGGHNVPRSDVLRRFDRGWKNFGVAY